jgi:hypothetical protein
MTPLRTLCLLLCFSAIVLGCDRLAAPSSKGATNPADLAKCLPEGVSLSTPLPRTNGTTIGQKLAELGAYAKEGKLYDRSGREIYFYQGIIGGPQTSPEMEKQRAEEERKLHERYTVIDLRISGV